MRDTLELSLGNLFGITNLKYRKYLEQNIFNASEESQSEESMRKREALS